MRLEGLLALITGGSGGIGQVIAKRFLEEGAEVIATGRSLEKLETVKSELGEFADRFHPIVMDASDLDSLLAGVQEIRKKFRKIDILVNNAGSAGPMERLPNIPLTKQNSETLQDALESLLGFPWVLSCALFLQLQNHASIINVSSIFSKFDYFGRAAYTVPKAALNMLSHLMAEELGHPPLNIRVNTLFPGPVESERIHRVFTAMDQLKNVTLGSTEKEIAAKMALKGESFLSKEDIANTVIYLASKESQGITNHDFEVTNGLETPKENTIEISLSPNPKIVNLDGHYTWIIGGSELEDACAIAQKHYDKGSEILLTFRDAETTKKASALYRDQLNFTVKLFDPTNTDDWKIFGKQFNESLHYPSHVFTLPHHSNHNYHEVYGDSVTRMPLEKIQDYLVSEIADAVITAKFLSKTFKSNYQALGTTPTIVFISNGSDKRGNKFDKIRSAAIEQLIRIWRYEDQFQEGEISYVGPKIWQLIRFNNEQADNLEFTTNLAISISAGITTATHINFAIARVTQHPPFEFTYNQKYHQMLGNLDGTVALLTGGSEGIGRETARIMVQGGAHVVIASRSEEKLTKTKKFLVKELTANGFPEAENRIFAVPLDVIDEASVENAFNKVISKYGRLDFLINNAGITGQEQMIFDMSVDGWNTTLQANLISNYDLMIRSLPYMKLQKLGSIINLSSAFGGQRYGTPSYPIRADYAVSKAGQRALSENFASLIGPEVKINTISPGPVEGDRVRGGGSRPGLYFRRAKINAENKRVNQIYNILIENLRKEGSLVPALNLIALNDISLMKENIPSLQKLIESMKKMEGEPSGSNTHLLTKTLAEKLLNRLSLGGFLPPEFDQTQFFNHFNEPTLEFLSNDELTKGANSIANRAVKMLALGRMPSEYDIGREIVFNLSSKSMTGETLYPSSGLSFDDLAISGDFPAEFFPSLYNDLQVKTVLIIGNSMHNEMAHVADSFCKAKSVEKVIIAGTQLEGLSSKVIFKNGSLDDILKEEGLPDLIISFPMGPLPSSSELPPATEFKKIVDEHLTNHFKVCRRGALIDNCRIFLVTHSLPEKSPKIPLAFSRFLGATLAPLTVTAGQECSRITHQATFYQINSEPYADPIAFQKKLSDAILLLSLPMTTKSSKGHVIRL